jgi:hypothetical protein
VGDASRPSSRTLTATLFSSPTTASRSSRATEPKVERCLRRWSRYREERDSSFTASWWFVRTREEASCRALLGRIEVSDGSLNRSAKRRLAPPAGRAASASGRVATTPIRFFWLAPSSPHRSPKVEPAPEIRGPPGAQARYRAWVGWHFGSAHLAISQRAGRGRGREHGEPFAGGRAVRLSVRRELARCLVISDTKHDMTITGS